MEKWVYDSFARWYHGGGIYFYSDPHFADEETKHLRKNYIGDQEQVDSINKVIGKNDTLIILGDIGDPSWLSKVRGHKILIMGNHDKGPSNYRPYFEEIYEGGLIISDKIIITHEPVEYRFAFNIHGHDHSGWNNPDGLHLNVCAEHINYTPVSLAELVKKGVFKDVPNIHRVTIDGAIDRKARKLLKEN